MRIVIVGAGAAGGFFGARLAAGGRDVTYLVRPARADQLRRRGLRISGLGAAESSEPQLVTADAITDPYDLILLSVKATGLPQAIDDVAPAVGPGSVLIPMLNGMAHVDALVERFGAAVLGGVAKVSTMLNDDGDIVRLADLQSLAYGELAGPESDRVRQVHEVLSGVGFDTAVSDHILDDMWDKWSFIASVGAVTCLLRGAIGEVAAEPGGTAFADAVLAECAAVSAAAGHPLVEENRRFTREFITRKGSAFTSSLYRDVAAGNSIEVEQIFGDLVGRARAFDVPVPLLELVTMQLRIHQDRVTRPARG
ncbi:MAG TPA: 2-dehydropantoate 2-reductase [Mycobacteriales bacterium]|jgi:2-dehydropantoate 2-reductase|nr:2-dehydropantoate 2-reductase [Mycobacteriales bacterium]